jgi:PilZ domain
MEERRALRRFNLKLPCTLCAYGGKEQARCELVTSNISSGGAYFSTLSPYTVGTRLSMRLMIQRSKSGSAAAYRACVGVHGEVVRADAWGMAVEFDDVYRIFRISSEKNNRHIASEPRPSIGSAEEQIIPERAESMAE